MKLAKYKNYMGFDVSETAIKKCKNLFKNDKSKKFYILNEYQNQKSDLSLSLDVIFHLIEDNVFEDYMKRLFESSNKYMIIYSSNTEELNKQEKAIHVKHRKFSNWIDKNLPNWKLIKRTPNKYPYYGDHTKGSFSDFYIYETNF